MPSRRAGLPVSCSLVLVALAATLSLVAAGCVRAGGLFGELDGRVQDGLAEAAEAKEPGPDFAMLSLDGPTVAVIGAKYVGVAINLGSVAARGVLRSSIMMIEGSGGGGTGSFGTTGVRAGPNDRFSAVQVVPSQAVPGKWLARFCAEAEGDTDPSNDCRDLSFNIVSP